MLWSCRDSEDWAFTWGWTASHATDRDCQHRQQQEDHSWLGHLPYELLLEVIARMAPPLRRESSATREDAEIMPPGVQPQHGPVADLAALLLGPLAPDPPAADAAAWFAAAAMFMGMPPGGAAVGGPLGAGAAAGVAGVPNPMQLLWPGGMGPPPPPPAAAADNPAHPAGQQPDVQGVALYTEALILANSAAAQVPALLARQVEEAARLTAMLEADRRRQAEAATAAATAQAQEGVGLQPAGEGQQQQLQQQPEEPAADGQQAAEEQDQGHNVVEGLQALQLNA
ncbi:hypothetical protein GPECTOR_34g704 [Gonium pectorale]|uniref:Uncharacterized protein n=1 Tax=Gonium pectorale TaxID=33097 RepID=A0A150GD83_GONPE|nr:hypothetical protein GPECTOR_34g704 [Gonium pectorale]|eukprot:KXZ47545.1 hypothetical protein GPECTOR_34g704 [Gonium pectorale]